MRLAFSPSGADGSDSGATPPRPSRRMRHPADKDLSWSFRWSVGLHAAIAIFLVLKSIVFPSDPAPYVSALRVDIVGLPDLLKNERPDPNKPSLSELESRLKETERQAEDLKLPTPTKADKAVEKADPAEMVLKPQKQKAEKTEDRQKKLRSALDRIKSLDKIAQLQSKEQQEKATAGQLIKGNQISKGTSLTGEARENAVATYFDAVRDALQSNWTLNAWLARQKFSARIQVYIDSRGNLRSYKFTKVSGNAAFDDAVKAAIFKSQPFPAPPEGIAHSVLVDGISVGFPL